MTPTTAPSGTVLDFNPTVGMRLDGAPPDDPGTEPWRAILVFAPVDTACTR